MQKRATVYFDSRLHKALRLKAAETERSVFDLVNDAVKRMLMVRCRRFGGIQAAGLGGVLAWCSEAALRK